jgi:predicted N-acyltransferase
MNQAAPTFAMRIAPSLADIPPDAWDACARGADPDTNPFVSHAFLRALEISGCVGGRTGWTPAHVLVEHEGLGLVAAAPCYLKTHSQGEYVFDHGWADAIERAGGRYYPKLQVSSPFSPVTGPRLLIRPDIHREAAMAALVEGLRRLRAQTGASSIHLTFLPEHDWSALGRMGFLQRTDQQFHWSNAGFASFDAFLETLASRKRKAIRKERSAALANGITISRITGADITAAHWDAFFAFYMDTGSRKWGRPYLNRAFFAELGRTMADRVLLVMAERAGRFVAGALNLVGHDTLFGRNWGCVEDHPFLHFEVCYYQAIEFAIERRLKRVEAGAQGEHKLARGYMPVTTFSAHDIADPRLRAAVADYLERERKQVAAVKEVLAGHGPFRKDLAEAERE